MVGGAVGAAIAVAALLVFATWRRVVPPTLSQEAERLALCIERGDSACVYAYVGEDERRAYDLTEAKLDRLMKRIVAPRLKGLRYVGQAHAPVPAEGTHLFYRYYTNSSGARCEVSVETATGEKGAHGNDVVFLMVFDAASASGAVPSKDPACALEDGLGGMIAELDEVGFPALYQVRENPPLQPVAEFLQEYSTAIASRGVRCQG